jgi:hypothetical protein
LNNCLCIFEISTPFHQEVQFALITGVAVGSGWQAKVAYINLGCYYYIIGIPLGAVDGMAIQLGRYGMLHTENH